MSEHQAQEEKFTRRRFYSPFLQHDNTDNNHQRCSSALIILNTPIPEARNSLLPDVFKVLWESTTFHICADGGANRLYDATIIIDPSSSNSDDDAALIPDLITGDLDSLRPDVRSYYEKRGVSIVCVEDQNYHDLDKSLMAVEKWIESTKISTSSSSSSSINGETDSVCTTSQHQAFIYGGFGGRFDQEMACINTLYSWGRNESFQSTQMSIYDEETGVILLPEAPIMNEILIRFPDVEEEEEDDDDDGENNRESDDGDREVIVVGEGPTCGLIPIGGRCERVYTSGLRWNLNGDMPLEFGGLVSSSNRIVEKVVTVKTSSPLLFSFEIVKRKCKQW